MEDEIIRQNRLMLDRVADSLRRKGFEVFLAADSGEAREKVLAMISSEETVGAGGSVTIKRLGILDELARRGNRLFDHWKDGIDYEERLRLRREQLLADVFLSSTNAVTESGELVNIDGVGNRVAALSFGPKHVVVVAGRNKVVSDVDEGLRRIRNVAAPANVRRLDRDLPCAKTGYCVDCKLPGRICRVVSIVVWPPSRTRFSVILVDEELGY